MFSRARAGRSADVRRELERGRPLAERGRASEAREASGSSEREERPGERRHGSGASRRKQRGSRRLPQAVGAVRRRPRGTGGPSARSRGSAARGHHRERSDRGAWFERLDASFVIAGNRRFPACSQNATRSDDIAGLRPASGQNPQDSGNITRELRSLKRQRRGLSPACYFLNQLLEHYP